MLPFACMLLALWGVVRSVMLVLANVRVCEWCCGCLCLLAPCFCIERFTYNPNHSSMMPLCLRCLFVVPVWLTYKMVHKWLVRLLPSHTLKGVVMAIECVHVPRIRRLVWRLLRCTCIP